MTTSEQINEIATAMAKAQAAMKPAIKDALNPAFRAKYADLTAVWESCRGPLTANGIATFQDVTIQGTTIAVTTRLVHSSGQWVEFGPLPVPSAKQDAHGVGSATSYARRYGLSAAVGVVADDDDGNAATVQGDGMQLREVVAPWQQPPAQSAAPISDAQRKRFFAISKEHGWKEPEVKALLKRVIGVESSKSIPSYRYDEITKLLEAGVDSMAATQ